MPKQSAGILLYRFRGSKFEVLLVHPGGPFWTKKDLGAWSIPKGEFTDEEDPLDAAKRELLEETGIQISGEFIELTPKKQKSGKVIYAFAIEHDIGVTEVQSNTFEIEWPPKSGKLQEFPEIDKAEWFDFTTSRQKLNESQAEIIEELANQLRMKGMM